MSYTETIIANAFRLPSLARDIECLVAEEMHKYKGPKAGATPLNGHKSGGFAALDTNQREKRRKLVLGQVSDKPIGRAEVIRRLPQFSACAIRNDLCTMAREGTIRRIGDSVATVYVRTQEVTS